MKRKIIIFGIIMLFFGMNIVSGFNVDIENTSLIKGSQSSINLSSNIINLGDAWAISEDGIATSASNLDFKGNISVTFDTDETGTYAPTKILFNTWNFIFDKNDEILFGGVDFYNIIKFDDWEYRSEGSDSLDGISFYPESVEFDFETFNKPYRLVNYAQSLIVRQKIGLFGFREIDIERARGEGIINITFNYAKTGITKEKQKVINTGTVRNDTINFEIGSYVLQSIYPQPNIPEPTIFMNPDIYYEVTSGANIHINAWLNWTVDLTEEATPIPMLPFIPMSVKMNLRAIGRNKIGKDQVLYPTEGFFVIRELRKNGTLHLSFDVDTNEYQEGVLFLFDADSLYYPTQFRIRPISRGHCSDMNFIRWNFI